MTAKSKASSSSYKARQKRALLDLAVATIADPSSEIADVEAARRTLVDGDRRLNFEALSEDELNTWRGFQRRLLGLTRDLPNEHPHDGCLRCRSYSDEDLEDLRCALLPVDPEDDHA